MWGYDNFVTDRESVKEIHCRVCGSRCRVKRNAYGPTCFAEAVVGKHRYHDRFCCPYTQKPWHRQALELKLALEKTPSKRVKALIRMDLEDVLNNRIV